MKYIIIIITLRTIGTDGYLIGCHRSQGRPKWRWRDDLSAFHLDCQLRSPIKEK